MNGLGLALTLGTPVLTPASPPGTFTYLRPGGVDSYLRPGGTDTYLRP